MNLEQILNEACRRDASDVHLSADMPPVFRVRGELLQWNEYPPLCNEALGRSISEILTEKEFRKIEKKGEQDFSYALSNGRRFRMNAFRQRGTFALAIRVFPESIKTFDQLGLPEVMRTFCRSRGLVLVAGPTGSGKSTTLAAMIDLINSERASHILTLEDPIEYVHKNKKSIIRQREIETDSKTFARALRAGLREDPDVILIGEMRDLETISIALTAAETGHLVFSTLHTGNVAQTIDRIIDVFPGNQQQQIRTQLALTLQGVVCQQLIPRHGESGRIAAFEILKANTAVRNCIREGHTYQLLPLVQGKQEGMIDMASSIKNLYLKGEISYEDASLKAGKGLEEIKGEIKENLGKI